MKINNLRNKYLHGCIKTEYYSQNVNAFVYKFLSESLITSLRSETWHFLSFD